MIHRRLRHIVAPAALVVAAMLATLHAHAATFAITPNQKLVGVIETYITHSEDTLLDVARNYDLGYAQLMVANRGIDPWLPGAGRRITVPGLYLLPEGPRTGIVINLAEQRIYYFPPGGHAVETFPIGTGVDAHLTPIGLTRIAAKETNPIWVPPPSIRAERPDLPERIFPGPDNPLGDFALRLGWSTYLIHGTNKPYGVGRHVSHGCIRLYPEDIERLFHEVGVGTPVRVIEEQIRLVWIGDDLYLAVFPTRQQVDQIDVNQKIADEPPFDLVDRVAAVAKNAADRVDWHAVGQAGRSRDGMPIRITRSATSLVTGNRRFTLQVPSSPGLPK